MNYLHSIRLIPVIALCVGASWGSAPLRAQSNDAELQQMRATMQEMAKTIQVLQNRVADLEKKEAVKKKEGIAAPSGTPAAKPSAFAVGAPGAPQPVTTGTSNTSDRNTFLDDQWPAPRVNNAPIDPSLKGFLQIPGTSTIIKLGGSARLDAIADDSNNGNPNEFIPSSFPVPGQPNAGSPSRSQIQAKASRVTFELRRPIGQENNLRIYYENDFFGDASSSTMTYRLRHFYGQAWNFLVGQTFSNFMDVDAFPDVIDYEGPNGLVNTRSPQVRYTEPFLDTKLQLAFAVEQPNSQINTGNAAFGHGASTVNRMPDLTAHLRYEEKKIGHIQLSGIYRYLSFDNDHDGQGVSGWGVSLAGSLNLFAHDTLTAEGTYGEGIARYIQDPSGLGEDAALDGHGNLRALPVWGVAVGYTHQWIDKWKSTVSYGYAHVDNEASNGEFAYDHSNYVSANLIYQWTPSFRMGLEYLYGTNEVRNGASHDGQRLNFVVKYDLVK
jgi:DcaP outer membrane protein